MLTRLSVWQEAPASAQWPAVASSPLCVAAGWPKALTTYHGFLLWIIVETVMDRLLNIVKLWITIWIINDNYG